MVALMFALVTVSAHAQAPRPGIRLTVTRVAPTGGFTASAFLVVHTTTIVRTPAPECGAAAVRIEARGHDAHGRVREAHVSTVVAPDDRPIDIGPGACAATVELVLDDGSALAVARGTVRGHLVSGSGLDAAVDGSVIDSAGVPTTVTGHIVLSPAS
jgi:hypothetical protein